MNTAEGIAVAAIWLFFLAAIFQFSFTAWLPVAVMVVMLIAAPFIWWAARKRDE